MFEIIIAEEFKRKFDELPKKIKKKFLRKIKIFIENLFNPILSTEKLDPLILKSCYNNFMTHQLIQYVEEKYSRKDLPEIKPGMVVRVWQRIKEKKREFIQPFEGIVIRVKNKKGTRKMFTVRGQAGGQMIEKTYPYNLPTIEKIEILKQGKARRAKLYFIRYLHPREIKKKLKI